MAHRNKAVESDAIAISEKGSALVNEDAYLIGKKTYAVFDGAMSVVQFQNRDGYTGGYLASNIAKATFGEEDSSLIECARKTPERIREAMTREGIKRAEDNDWCTGVVAVRLENGLLNWIQLGDSFILLVYKDGSHKLLSEDDEHDKETLIVWKRLAEQGIKDLRRRPEIEEGLREVRKRLNVDYGFITSHKLNEKLLRTGTETTKNITHVLLFTDGLKIPQSDPAEKPDFERFVSIFLEGERSGIGNGIKALRDHVRRLEWEDPDCTRYPRFKQYDDLTAVDVRITA